MTQHSNGVVFLAAVEGSEGGGARVCPFLSRTFFLNRFSKSNTFLIQFHQESSPFVTFALQLQSQNNVDIHALLTTMC